MRRYHEERALADAQAEAHERAVEAARERGRALLGQHTGVRG